MRWLVIFAVGFVMLFLTYAAMRHWDRLPERWQSKKALQERYDKGCARFHEVAKVVFKYGKEPVSADRLIREIGEPTRKSAVGQDGPQEAVEEWAYEVDKYVRIEVWIDRTGEMCGVRSTGIKYFARDLGLSKS